MQLNEQIERCTNEHINEENVSCYSLFWVVKFSILHYDNDGLKDCKHIGDKRSRVQFTSSDWKKCFDSKILYPMMHTIALYTKEGKEF